MNPIKTYIIKRLTSYFQNKGIGIVIDNINFKKGVTFESIKIDFYGEKCSISIINCIIKLKSLFHGNITANFNCKNITIKSGRVSSSDLHIEKSKYIVQYIKHSKEIIVKIELDKDINLLCKFEQNINNKEFFIKVEDISIDKYKQLFNGHIISQFMKQIESDSLITILGYYRYNKNCKFPKLNIRIKHDSIYISPSNYKLSKQYLINELKQRKHLCTTYKSINDYSKKIRQIIICTEDPSFELHNGVSLISMGMNIQSNIQRKCIKGGGSTISMQLIKNALLCNQQTFTRKMEEAILTILMENHYYMKKQDILEIYLNMIEFAPNVYGIEDAAQWYFNKPSAQLNCVEIIVLTYIIPRPIFFHEALLKKTEQLRNNLRNHINFYLDVIIQKRIISQKECRLVKANTIYFSSRYGELTIV